MKTLLKKSRTGAVILAVVGIVSPPAAWAGGSKTGHVASHAQSGPSNSSRPQTLVFRPGRFQLQSRPSNRAEVVQGTKASLTGIQRVVNTPGGNGPSGQVTIGS